MIFLGRYIDWLLTTPVSDWLLYICIPHDLIYISYLSARTFSNETFLFQLLLLDIALLVNADVGEITMLLGNDVLMVLAGNSSLTHDKIELRDYFLINAGAIGSTLLNPYKWYW